jgi:oxygen-independent coproporphyrinogen-3 oxidase
LYIHIPFCAKKCFYCDFYSIQMEPETAESVIEEIIKEIRFFFNALPEIVVHTIFIGGGTPSCLPPALFECLLKAITTFPLNNLKEWSVEANPESVDRDFIALCNNYGVTRLSLGIQSTDDSLLKELGRITSFSDIERSAGLLNRYWEKDLNTDLMAGIPGQSQEQVLRDIEYILVNFNCSHISLYALSVENKTILKKLIQEKKIRLPSSETRESLWFSGARILASKGFHQYEISNFAKAGKECIHNLNYWHLNPYIGIGPGAVSTLPGKEQTVIRIDHPKSISQYLKANKNYWGMEYEAVDNQSFLFETCMMGFRLTTGISRQQFISRYGVCLEKIVPGLWEEWEGRGLAASDPDMYMLSKKGRCVLNPLLIELSEHLDLCDKKILKVRWP